MLTISVSGQTISIVGEMQVHYLQTLKEGLAQALQSPEPLMVDLGGVRDVDVAGLQTLLAFVKSRAGHAPTSLGGAQPSLLRALELTGLDRHLAACLA